MICDKCILQCDGCNEDICKQCKDECFVCNSTFCDECTDTSGCYKLIWFVTNHINFNSQCIERIHDFVKIKTILANRRWYNNDKMCKMQTI